MRSAFLLAVVGLVACGSEPEDQESNDPVDDGDANGPQDEEDPLTKDELYAELTGEWHGEIGPDYQFGCLCLTLDETGAVIHPSGITMGFGVKDGGGTTIVSLEDREIDIATLVSGSVFHIEDAYLSDDASQIEGQWTGENVSEFDSTIVLDRDPASCEDRTGLWGAPC
jgi:hypothetical protein